MDKHIILTKSLISTWWRRGI